MKSDYKGFVRKDVQKFIDNGGVGPLFDGIHNWGSLQVLTIDSPLKPLLIQNLLSELNSFIFLEKASDLFQFQQSLDFRQLEKDSKPMCVKLHKIFEKHLKKLAGSLFNIDLSGEVSMTASKYCYKDFLMCHDDQVEDRGVAFILYLEDWQKENGGTLDFFHHDERGLADDVTFSILPIANRLVLFSVNDLSHHQVAEVLCKDKPRLAISGWFHTGKTINRSIKLLTDRAPIFSPVLMDHPVTEIAFEMDYLYLQNDVSYFAVNAKALRAEIVNNRCVLLKPFLNEKCYNSVLDELQSSKVKWHNVGSAARRKYEVAEMNRRRVNNCPAISELLFKLQGTSFFKILSLFIMKKLDDADEARISIATEVIRFKKGNYMLVVDDKMYNKQSSVDLWVFFNADHIDSTTGGDFGYFNQKKKRTLSLTPSSNGAFIVARMPNLLPFMAYMNNDTGDNIHYAISVKYSVSYKLSELRGPLTQLSAIIYGNENKMTVVNEINEQARMKKKATDHQVDTHQKRRKL